MQKKEELKIFIVPEGHSFTCFCGCKGKTVKSNAKAMFKRLSVSGNCKDKHFGNKRQLVKVLSEVTEDMKLDMKKERLIFIINLMNILKNIRKI